MLSPTDHLKNWNKRGDRIVSIENKNVAGVGITNQDVIKELRGEGGTYVKVGINRKITKEISVFNIKRGKFHTQPRCSI